MVKGIFAVSAEVLVTLAIYWTKQASIENFVKVEDAEDAGYKYEFR